MNEQPKQIKDLNAAFWTAIAEVGSDLEVDYIHGFSFAKIKPVKMNPAEPNKLVAVINTDDVRLDDNLSADEREKITKLLAITGDSNIGLVLVWSYDLDSDVQSLDPKNLQPAQEQ